MCSEYSTPGTSVDAVGLRLSKVNVVVKSLQQKVFPNIFMLMSENIERGTILLLEILV